MKRVFIKTLLAAAALCAVGLAGAQDIKERSFKLGLQNPKGHPLVTGAEKFAEIVAAKSGGKIKVNLFPGGVLGGDAATVSALQGGTVEMTALNSGILASQVKDFEVFDFPFMFADACRSRRRGRRPLRPEAARQAGRQGHRRPGLLGAGLSQHHQQQARRSTRSKTSTA